MKPTGYDDADIPDEDDINPPFDPDEGRTEPDWGYDIWP